MKEKKQFMQNVVSERIAELLEKSEKLKSYIYISKGVTTLTAVGALTTGMGQVMNVTANQNDLLGSTIALGGISLASAVTNRILTKKNAHIENERRQLEKLSENRYIENMQVNNDLNYDNFSAAQLSHIEDIEIEF